MYREPPRELDAVEARILWRRRYVVPLVVVMSIAALFAVRSTARAHVALTLQAYASPRYEPETETAHARSTVGAYEVRTGSLVFGDRSSGEMYVWYAHAHVRDARVRFDGVIPRDGVPLLAFWGHPLHGPPPASETVSIGFETGDARDHDDVARAIEAWMNGPRTRPFETTWWLPIGPEVPASLGLIAACLIALLALRRARVRASIEDGIVRIDVRRLFGARTEIFPRTEIRTITIEAHVFGPLSFARPLVITTQGRKIPIGPCMLPDVIAAELAHALPR
jgi:hypothetical protein